MTQHEAMVGALLATLVSAQVVNVADGDTLNVLQGNKVLELQLACMGGREKGGGGARGTL